jgi:NADH-quinone oxidoreductase subunit G
VINFTIDGMPVSVPKGTTVYQAAKQLGIDIPIFCYQDRMPPFGACRVCLVEVEKMNKLQTSCTLEPTEGMAVKTQSAMAAEGREEILEFLLINHPLDCPICDKGGECPLQDQTMKFGPGRSRFYEDKRHFKKAIPLGPVLELDRERCIVCARCTRFGDEIAGDHALEFIDRGYKTEVGTPGGKPAESKFIGNTIMICPVGALTSRVYRFRARPWDNDSIATTCTLCPVGCSMKLDSRDGEIMRTRSQENRDVNDIWLCDKGWFGYEFASHPDRLQTPLIRRNGALTPASWDEALSLIVSKIHEAKGSGKGAAWGGNPLTTEESYLFQQLIRKGIGVNHVDHRIGQPILTVDEEGIVPGMDSGMAISIGECEALSFILLAGIDLTEEFPVIWLRLKQAINRGAKAVFLGHYAPEIAKHLNKTILHTPGNEIDTIRNQWPQLKSMFANGQKGAIFVGSQYLMSPDRRAVLAELAGICQSTPNLSLNVMEGRGNSAGARLAGMRPDLYPLGKRITSPGLNAVQVLEAAAASGWDLLYIAGANPAVKFPSTLWAEARKKLGFLIVQDLFLTETARQADVVLPTLSCMEKEGSFINIEGRVQQIHPGKAIPDGVFADGDIFTRLAAKLGLSLSRWETEAGSQEPGDRSQEPEAGSQETEGSQGQKPVESEGIPTSTLAATFAYALFDNGVRMQHDPHLIQLAKEPCIRLHPSEAVKRGFRDADVVTLSANGGKLTAKIKLDHDVAEGTVVIPVGFKQLPVYELGLNLLNGMVVMINGKN